MSKASLAGLAIVLWASGGAVVPPALAAPVATDLNSLIRSESGGKYRDFYEDRGFRPLWIAGGRVTPVAARLIDLLAASRADGLDPGDYDMAALRDAIAAAGKGDPRALARAEVMLSHALVDFVTDMRAPARTGMTFLDKSVKPKKRGTGAVLRSAALAPSFADYVGRLGWMNPHYARQRGLMARAMKAGASEAVLARLRLNLERARILPSAYTHHIVVDAASGRLWYYQAGAQKGTMKVVVGKPESPTPMYAGVVQYAVLKPYWNVPVDLVRKLVAPKVLAGKSLKSMGFEAMSGWGENARIVDPATIDWVAVKRGDIELRVRQLPGPRNSMGKVKFMFPNETGIFLHDTPERNLFAKADRHFSNGCVRLEDAAALGRWLMGKPLPTGAAKPDQAVMLNVPVPIYMTYFTATEGKAGVAFLKDVYRRDAKRG